MATANPAVTFTIQGTSTDQSASWDHTIPTFSVIVRIVSITSADNYKIQVECVKYSTEANYENDDEINGDEDDYEGGYYNAHFYVTVGQSGTVLCDVPAQATGKRYSFDYTGSVYTVSNDDDFTIYAHCGAANCVDDQGAVSSSTSYAHVYKIFNVKNEIYEAPSNYNVSITGRTGTTITAQHTWTTGTVSGGNYSIRRLALGSDSASATEVKDPLAKNTNYTFTTNIANATSYTIYGRIDDGTSNTHHARTANDSTITYGCSVSYSDRTTNSVKLTFASTGYSYDISTSGITYTIRKDNASGTVVVSATNTTSTSITVTGLQPDTTYYVSVYLTTVTDATASTSFTTLTALKIGTPSAVSTGTTITVTVPVTRNSSTGTITLYVTLNGTTLTATMASTTTSGNLSVTFTGLSTGTTYSFSCYASDANSNSSSTATGSTTTYKVVITVGSADTKTITFSISITTGDSSRTSKTITYRVTGGNCTGTYDTLSSYSGSFTCNSLNHNTTYTIEAYVTGMTNTSGSYDTVVTATMKTQLLSVANTGITCYQHSIVTTWQAYADGVAYDKTTIKGDSITFSIGSSASRAVGSAATGYQTPSGNESGNTTSGDYQSNKTLTSSGLAYYALYTIYGYISDGHNVVGASVSGYTTFPFCYVRTSDGWKKAMPYIYTEDNGWILAPAYICKGSIWKECNGE